MRHKLHPTLVGAFVVGAVLLGLGGIVLLGSKDLFRDTYPFVSYFESSVNGLRAGAPVKFKGVEVGSVDQIRLPMTRDAQDPAIAVFFSLDAEKLRSADETELGEEELRSAIEAGLRARLELESFVTGVLYVSIAFVPESEPKVHAPIAGIPEIPTAPTEFEELTGQLKRFAERLEHVDLAALVADLQGVTHSLDALLTSGQIQAVLTSLERTLVDVSDSSKAVSAVSAALDRDVEQLTGSLAETLGKARDVLDPSAPPMVRLDQVLAELSATARAARAVLEILERDPSALVRGKGETEERR